MDFIILTEFGPKIGFGHLSRCISLYDEIKNQNYNVKIILNGKYQEKEFTKNRNIVNYNWIDKNFIIKNINSNNYCIVDSYLATNNILETISKAAKKVLFLDDGNRLDYPKGIVVNPSFDIGKVKYLFNEECEYVWGSKYIILRYPFSDIKVRKTNVTIRKVLITFGGTENRKLIIAIVKLLYNINNKYLFEVVSGMTSLNLCDFDIKMHDNLVIYDNIDEYKMKNLMLNADLAISSAGQTIYELISCNTPFIPIQTAENQDNNINSLLKFGLIDFKIDYHSNTFSQDMNENISRITDINFRNALILKYQSLIDGKGSKRIVELIINSNPDEIYFKKAEFSDCELLYRWTNDELVRLNAFNTDIIEYQSHIDWFHGKLKSNLTEIYIFYKKNIPFGQVRIDIHKNYGLISYSIDHNFRGKGFGKIMIKSIVSIFENELQNIEYLIAKVKFENFASQKVFQGLNFIKSKKKNYYRYIFKK
jgi:UDP-2,4-diacetamido-2,4,6-trideoxy-beta-L-altropyranose hydrolase